MGENNGVGRRKAMGGKALQVLKKDERVAQILELAREGQKPKEIAEWINAQWGLDVTPQAVRQDLEYARARAGSLLNLDAQTWLAAALIDLEFVVEEAKAAWRVNQDARYLSVIMRAVADRSKLVGVGAVADQGEKSISVQMKGYAGIDMSLVLNPPPPPEPEKVEGIVIEQHDDD